MGIMDELNKEVTRLKELCTFIECKQEELDALKSIRDELEQKTIPMILLETGFSEAKTISGLSVKIETHYSAKVLDEPKFFQWARANGLSDVIRYTFDVSADDALSVQGLLKEEIGDFESSIKLHPMTLKKIIKDRSIAGEPLPTDDVCKISIFNKARVTG